MNWLDAAMRAIYSDVQCGPYIAGKNTVAKLSSGERDYRFTGSFEVTVRAFAFKSVDHSSLLRLRVPSDVFVAYCVSFFTAVPSSETQ